MQATSKGSSQPELSGTSFLPPPQQTKWHAWTASKTLDAFASNPNGLSSREAAARLVTCGPNRLKPPKAGSTLARFLHQFQNVLIYVLLAAAGVTAALGHWTDSGVIIAVVIINAAIGFVQEGRAERALDAIRDILSPVATVFRDRRRMTIQADGLVPGDVVAIQSGDKVPADLRLIRMKNLRIQEAVLTGESMPVDKSLDPVPPDALLGDRNSMAFSGTLVIFGQGTGVVVATGDASQIGQVSELLAGVETLTTPLLRQMEAFGRWLTVAIVALSAITFGIGVLGHGFLPSDMFLAAVGLAVAAIPEGLPAIMTITLAIGVERMARRNAIIRRLPAVETLGSVSIICSDKTGTFTRNEMMVQNLATGRHMFEVSGAGYAPSGEFLLDGVPVSPDHRPRLQALTLGALLCSDATVHQAGDGWRVDGDPMEAAFSVVGAKAGLDPEFERKARPRTDEIPFEAEHQFMATLHHDHEGNGIIYVKGAPERVLDMCESQHNPGGDGPIDRPYWRARIDEMAARGERVLALGVKAAAPDKRALTFADIADGVTLLGLFGLADPVREEAIDAVAACRGAGIRVKMITGDHAGTARAIATRLALQNSGDVLTGADLDRMPAKEMARRAANTDVFARTSPEHKLRLVEALQSHGDTIAMTGDGVNDAPALKRAGVGIAMGRKGSEAAKEAAEMVLADDNFASIAHAVEEGRTVYDNIKKSILFILPTSGGEAFTIVVAVSLGLALPITAVQILWINMITTVTLALALAFEPPEAGVMKRPPRRADEPILSGFAIWRIVYISSALVAGVFGVFTWATRGGMEVEAARTVAVNTLVMFEAFYLLSVRRLEAWAFSGLFVREARVTWGAIAALVAIQMLFTYAPVMQTLFHSRPLSLDAWIVIVSVAASVFVLVEIEKSLLRARRKMRRG
jgi:magnesium-transporting ATPase (P-type)